MGRHAIERNYKFNVDGKLIISGNLPELPKIACYDGNRQIKKAGVLIEYEQWQIEELIKCSNDIEYFAEKYCTIIDADEGKRLISLRPYQKKMLNHLLENRFSIILASRQVGKSLIAALYLAHHILFNNDRKIAIIANKGSISKEIFQKVRVVYEKLPYFLQIGVVEWQKTTCRLENGSSIFSDTTTAEGIRGMTASTIFLDEFGFIDRNIADEFFASVYPTISASKKSKIIVVSTPNGLNLFYEMWKKAINKKNTFAPFRVDWWEVEGRDEAWKEETIKNIGNRKFSQEFGNDFIGSASTLIKSTILESMESREPITTMYDGKLKIYTYPIRERIHSIGVDTGKGTGNDYSVANVFDITTYPFRQVAIYRSNEISTRNFAEVIIDIAKKYNDAYLMIENNDIGQTIVDYVWNDVEYENLVNYNTAKRADLGVRSTKKTKSLANDIVKQLIEDYKLEICDMDTIYELSKYTELKQGRFGAEEGENDDCVTSMLWAIFIIKTNYLESDEIKDEVSEVGDDELEIQKIDDEPVDMMIR